MITTTTTATTTTTSQQQVVETAYFRLYIMGGSTTHAQLLMGMPLHGVQPVLTPPETLTDVGRLVRNPVPE